MLTIILVALAVYLLLQGGWKYLSAPPALRAVTDLYKASKLTDSDVRKMAGNYVAWMDAQNNLLPDEDPYTQRLYNLSDGFLNRERYHLGVYKTGEINAFACADGSIRVFSGLMDRMTDGELLAIIGHEMGHIVHRDTLRAMSNACVASAVRHAVSAAGGTLGNLTGSALGEIALKLTGAKFSRDQEYAADDYAFRRIIRYDSDPFAMADALDKLAALASSSQNESTTVQLGSMFSTHPDSAGRAARMRTRARNYLRREVQN